jgi:AcrR family transcriptional regulator
MSAVAETDGRRRRGAIARSAALAAAVDLGSREGLEALTIGRLADATAMSKSGLFAHFGSKQSLQLATVARARDTFVAEVVVHAIAADARERLDHLLEAWMSYMERDVFPGGCFFMAASAEWDAREGPVRDAVVEAMTDWLAFLAQTVEDAGLASGDATGQLVFELNAVGVAANWEYQLYGRRDVFARARASFARVLGDAR